MCLEFRHTSCLCSSPITLMSCTCPSLTRPPLPRLFKAMCPPHTLSLSACSCWHVCMTCVLSVTEWIHSTLYFFWMVFLNFNEQNTSANHGGCVQQMSQLFSTTIPDTLTVSLRIQCCLTHETQAIKLYKLSMWHPKTCPESAVVQFKPFYEEIKLSLSVHTLYPKSCLQDRIFVTGLFLRFNSVFPCFCHKFMLWWVCKLLMWTFSCHLFAPHLVSERPSIAFLWPFLWTIRDTSLN